VVVGVVHYRRSVTYCTRDARRLVPPEDMLGGPGLGPLRALSRSAGLICMACRRAYEPGLRTSHTTHRAGSVSGLQRDPAAPRQDQRAHRHDRPDRPVSAQVRSQRPFCGHDAGQLVVIN